MAASIRDQFVKDIAQHQIDIQLDQGAFRHVVFKRPNTIHQLFSLTTTPGRLVFGGDMGCFVFERTGDMFAFFRRDIDRFDPNLGYWHEKLVAVDRRGGSMIPSVEKFRENLEQYIEQYDDLTGAEIGEVRDFIDEAVTLFQFECPYDAYVAVGNFELRDYLFFTDFFETSNDDYTISYLWACHAIQWGIAKYDKAKQVAEPLDAEGGA
jgi:hypothetical protein